MLRELMARVNTFQFNNLVSEYELAGMLCFMDTIFGVQHPLNIEVSLDEQSTLFPPKWGRSFNSAKQAVEIRAWSLELQQPKPGPYLQVDPIPHRSSWTFYLDNHEEFMRGYMNMSSITQRFIQTLHNKKQDQDNKQQEPAIAEDYKSEWEADPIFLSQAKLIAQPGEVINKPRQLPPIFYVWDLPGTGVYMEQTVVNLVMLFVKECTEADHKMLMDQESYLNLKLYQDTPDGSPYVCAYIRLIDDCTYPSHKLLLSKARESKKFYPCEINYVNTGYFFEFPRDHWEKKQITFIGSFG